MSTKGHLHTFFAFVAFASILAVVAKPAYAQSQDTVALTQQRIPAAMEGFRRFQSSRSPDDLVLSSRALLGSFKLNGMSAADAISVRRAFLASYSQLIRAIVSLEDPDFDRGSAKYVAFTCLVPPMEPNGVQLPSCADPNDIVDIATRNTYVHMLEVNREAASLAMRQIQLRMVDQEITGALRSTLQLLRLKAPSDDDALDRIMRTSGLAPDRQNQIRSWYE